MNSYSGYEEYMENLKSYTKEQYIESEDKDGIINEVFEIYRKVNIYPNMMFTDIGIKDEIQKCIDKDVDLIDGTLGFKFNQGSSLCRFLFSNIRKVDCKGTKNNSLQARFEDDYKLKRAIKFCLEHKTVRYPCVPSAIKDGLEMMGGNVATNFPPMKAKTIYEKYCKKDGIIYDFSCGFGGRMLGALSSKNNYKYIGVEPNTETYRSLHKLGKAIEKTTNTTGRYSVQCKGSEDVHGVGIADFAFSSPPYFALEKYCDEDTQCYIKYPTLDEWFEGYVRPTIRGIYNILKDDRHYAVNIADFNVGKKRIEFVDRWIEISKEEGFIFEDVIPMKLETRRGHGHAGDKKEGVYVFYKAS